MVFNIGFSVFWSMSAVGSGECGGGERGGA